MNNKLDHVRIASALAGLGDEIAHVKLLMGPRGSPVETAFCERMVATGNGRESLVTTLAPNLACKPNTLLVNHNAFVRPNQTVLLYGPVQAAVAQAVTRFALGASELQEHLDDLYLIVSVYIHPDAHDQHRVFVQNRDAVTLGLRLLLEQESPSRLSDDLAALKKQLDNSPADPY